jgi:glycine oxidase
MKPVGADVVVIGAGVIGCAIARELAKRGRDVMVIERDSPGRRATWAAAGMLSPLGEAGAGGPFLELSDASLQRYASFAHELREETGIDIEYRTNGKLYVSTGTDDERLRRLAADPVAQRFEVSLMDGNAARALEPALADAVSLALLIGRDHRANNRLLAQAVLAAATSAGARFRMAVAVASLVIERGAVAGVRLLSGEHIETRCVVLAAGAWSSQLEGLPRALPIRPVKGQMFAVDSRLRGASRATERPVQRTIYAADCYIIPREDGRLLVGATVEDVGFRKGVTPRGIAGLMHAAVEVVPAIADMSLVETWAGFRPATPDGMPVLGADPTTAGLFYATGHFRNGILLTPITAVGIADLIAGTKPPVDLEPFGIERFGDKA